ncbi:hypothetical protein Vau01_005890 [Virgisporangium aurantiacum]|uniref:Uncharacterized protein n=1 Tax=Virgisporangium aurantiacum TaxID=175570 RepID=A0A8J3YYN3_9ACTN|nr:hypothetical protein Vau01_005890 [Virgisporangium aurantiacum]
MITGPVCGTCSNPLHVRRVNTVSGGLIAITANRRQKPKPRPATCASSTRSPTRFRPSGQPLRRPNLTGVALVTASDNRRAG